MSISIVNALVTAVVSALQAGTPAAPQIDRVRLQPLKASTTSAVVVRAMDSQATTLAIGFTSASVWTTPLVVECYVKVPPGTAPDVAVDALACDVYARLMADPTLGGVVASLLPDSLSYDFDTEADKFTCAIFGFTARHQAGAQVFV